MLSDLTAGFNTGCTAELVQPAASYKSNRTILLGREQHPVRCGHKRHLKVRCHPFAANNQKVCSTSFYWNLPLQKVQQFRGMEELAKMGYQSLLSAMAAIKFPKHSKQASIQKKIVITTQCAFNCSIEKVAVTEKLTWRAARFFLAHAPFERTKMDSVTWGGKP